MATVSWYSLLWTNSYIFFFVFIDFTGSGSCPMRTKFWSIRGYISYTTVGRWFLKADSETNMEAHNSVLLPTYVGKKGWGKLVTDVTTWCLLAMPLWTTPRHLRIKITHEYYLTYKYSLWSVCKMRLCKSFHGYTNTTLVLPSKPRLHMVVIM